MATLLPECPVSLRSIQPFLKAATEHETRDPVISYWCRLYALQNALKIDKKSDDAVKLLGSLMDWLEGAKKRLCDNEAISNDIAAQAHIENYALKLFHWADGQDRASVFNKNVVKAFFTAGLLMDVLTTFGELGEDIVATSKYAKWKAAYIHNCLKNGETPIPGPAQDGMTDEAGNEVPNFPGGGPSFDQMVNDFEKPVTPSWQPSSSDIASTSNIVAPPQNFNSQIPSPSPSTADKTPLASNGVKLDVDLIAKAQKMCRFAGSALNYDDVAEAINYLEKAMSILKTGEDC